MCPVGELVGGCGARAVTRKTPIYFIIIIRPLACEQLHNIILLYYIISPVSKPDFDVRLLLVVDKMLCGDRN